MMGFSDFSQDDEWRIEVAIFPSGQAFPEQWLPSAREDGYRLVWRAKTTDCVEVFGRVYEVIEGTGGVSFRILEEDTIPPRVVTDPTAYVVPFRGHAGLHNHVLGARPVNPGEDGKSRVALEIVPQGKRLKMSLGVDHPKDAIFLAQGDEFEITGDATLPVNHRYRVSGIVAPDPESHVLGWIHVHAVVPPKTGP
jgi:hypothetical protein